MSGLAAALALAVQVVTLDPAVIAEKAVYVRVAVGADSSIEIDDGMVTVHGQRALADSLGLKLGYARPTTRLLLHPRSSALGEIRFVGLKHKMRLHIEASTLGEAQDLEIRIAESDDKAAAAEAPRAQVSGSSSVAPEASAARAQTPKISSVAPAAPSVDGYPGPPPPRRSVAATQSRASQPRANSAAAARATRSRAAAPTPAAPASSAPEDAADVPWETPPNFAGLVTRPTPRPNAAAASEATAAPGAHDPSAASPATTTAACPVAPASITKRLLRRVGRPGQRGIVLEELRREGAQVTLRARVEHASEAQFVELALGAFTSTLSVDRDGRDLILTGTVTPTPTASLRNVTLVMDFGGHWEAARFRLPQGGTL